MPRSAKLVSAVGDKAVSHAFKGVKSRLATHEKPSHARSAHVYAVCS
jgi:hypothetical protein